MKFLRILLLSIAISTISNAASAWWGPTGHRVVGEIASKYLTGKARNAIREILGTESIAISSNWADFVKSDTSLNYLSPWHYVNIKAGLSNSEFNSWLKKDTITDAYTKLNFLIAELKNKQLSLEKKQKYLKLLIHIVGDIHQPLHVGRLEDQGGNRIKVQWFNEPANLHSVWDEKLIEMQKLSYTEYTLAINHSTKTQRKNWQQQPLEQWLYESYQLAEKIYGSITQPDQKIGFRYNFDFIEIVNQQLLKGGIHLAGLLNEIYS